MSRKMNHVRFLKLYDQGKTDPEIAKELGLVVGTVAAHRSKLGLVSHFVRKNGWPDADVVVLRRMANAGKTAKQIAAELKCDPKRVMHKARSEKIKLAVNRECKRYSAADDAEILRSLASGEAYATLAERLGRTAHAIGQRRSILIEKRDLAEAVALEAVQAERLAKASAGGGLPKSSVPLMVRRRGGAEPDRQDGLTRLAARCGTDLVAELAKIPNKKTYSKLDAVAQRHGLPFQHVQSLWHQVRVV